MMLVCSELPPTSHAGGLGGVGSVQDRAQREHPPEQGPAGTEEVYRLDPAARSWVQEMNQIFPQVTGRGLLPPPGSPVPANTHPWLGAGRRDLTAGENTVSRKRLDASHGAG